jgi:hypothetical protein
LHAPRYDSDMSMIGACKHAPYVTASRDDAFFPVEDQGRAVTTDQQWICMKHLTIPFVVYLSLSFGCAENSRHDNDKYWWPDKSSVILFEIRDTSKEDFLHRIDNSNCLTEAEKKKIKSWPLGWYPDFRLAKWKHGEKTIISIDQSVPHKFYDSKTGQSRVFRSGARRVLVESKGKREEGWECVYDGYER